MSNSSSSSTSLFYNDSSSSSSSSSFIEPAATCEHRSSCSEFQNPYSCYVSAYSDCVSGAFGSLLDWFSDHAAGIGGVIGAIVGVWILFCCVCICCNNQTRIWRWKPQWNRNKGYTALSTSDTNSNLSKGGVSPASLLSTPKSSV
jgi:hypothetical protein